jgi:hypothetical protein
MHTVGFHALVLRSPCWRLWGSHPSNGGAKHGSTLHACRCERILHTARRVGDVAETFSTPLVMQSAIVIHRSQSHHQVLRQ